MGWDRAKRWEGLVMAGAVLLAAFLVRSTLFTVIRVEGQSMRETYQGGELLLVTVPDLWLQGPRQGDVVILRYPGQQGLFVKRVAALGGQQVALRQGRLYVDGYPVQEEPGVVRDQRAFGPVTVPQDSVFVLGDNRPDSMDSRMVGPVQKDMLVGRVLFQLTG